ncbi:MAG TPA: hypothetical protein VL944_01680 [Candidatus Acidoferrum sp.]|nr:hypothetical protein [Candidatus Acidoferrum sp.]
MAKMTLKRYGLEKGAKVLILIGVVLNLAAWIIAAHYAGIMYMAVLFIAPAIFTLVFAITLLVVRYRYTLFEKYPYLINLPSMFYRLGANAKTQSKAFTKIYTVHAVVLAVLGVMDVLLTTSIGRSTVGAGKLSFVLYLIVVAVLIVSVFLLYRRIYMQLKK